MSVTLRTTDVRALWEIPTPKANPTSRRFRRGVNVQLVPLPVEPSSGTVILPTLPYQYDAHSHRAVACVAKQPQDICKPPGAVLTHMARPTTLRIAETTLPTPTPDAGRTQKQQGRFFGSAQRDSPTHSARCTRAGAATTQDTPTALHKQVD